MKNQNKQTNSLNKGLVTVCLSLLFCTTTNAQDKITFKTGDEVNARVLEINSTQIKYKQFDNLEGPLKIVNKTDIFSIKYQNGSKDVFSEETINIMPVTKEVVYVNQPVVDNKFDLDSTDFAKTKRKTFSGPRVGFTYIAAGTAADYLAREGKQPLITQFGWQFERRLFKVEGNTQGIFEFIPMIGGVEQGMFIPSASFLIGLRGGEKRTFEFAMGPNFSVVPNYLGQHRASIGLVIAAGTSFKSGNINFPVNLAFVPSVGSKESVMDANGVYSDQKFQTGCRLSLVVGFNSRKK